jgi:hypothetical protein
MRWQIYKKKVFKKVLKRCSPPRRYRQEILQQGVVSSGGPSRGTYGTSESTAEIPAKGTDEPVVRNLPEVISRASLSESAVLRHHCRELAALA